MIEVLWRSTASLEGDMVGVEIGVGVGVAGTGFSITGGSEDIAEEGTFRVPSETGMIYGPRCSSGDVVSLCELNGT